VLVLQLGADTLDLSDYETNGLYVDTVDIGAPAVREVVNDAVDRHGTTDETAYFGARLITLSGTLIASEVAGTRQEILDRLRLFCRPGTRPTLTVALNDDVPRVITLRPDQCASPITAPGRCPFAAAWKAPDPRFYSLALDSVVVYPPMSATGGRTYPLTFSRTYPSSWGGSGFADVTVAGDMATWATYRIDGPATNPVLTVTDDAGHTSSVGFASLTLAVGDYITVDTDTKTVYLNGDPAADRYSTLDVLTTRWGPLWPGHNRITFDAAAFAASCQLTATWRPAYL
jgi:Siphovirus-type tail component, C-terminal domain